jgi:pimeloyl-ACP methyl ester carboxylesterase
MEGTATIERPAVPRPKSYYTEPEWVDVAGLPTAYRRKGAGETVVFLHGAGMTRMWLPMYERLSQSVDLVAPEHPGCGAMPMPDWLRGIPDVVIHYHEFFRVMGLADVHLVGFSMGGWIAAEIASYYPDLLKSLTLVTPVGLKGTALGPDLFELGPERIMGKLFNHPDKMEPFLPNEENGLDEIGFLFGEGVAVARMLWTPRYNIQLARRLGRVSCPSQVIRAGEDRLVPDQIAQGFLEALPDARSVTIADCGHALIAEQPDATADAIATFVKGV